MVALLEHIMNRARSRRAICVVCATLVSVATVGPAAQGPPLPTTTLPIRLDGHTGTFLIRLPSSVRADGCEVRTLQTGAFGGLAGQATPPAIESNTIRLATGRDDKPAQTLKAVVWCPGYGFGLIDEPALERSKGETTIAMKLLRDVEVSAKVLPAPDGRNLTGLQARVFYVADWICGFFNLPDCGVPAWIVATPRIGIDGDLRFSVPDFASDPAITAYMDPGAFRLDVLPDRPPYGTYVLEAEGGARGTFGMIAVANRYPAIVMLRPRVR